MFVMNNACLIQVVKRQCDDIDLSFAIEVILSTVQTQKIGISVYYRAWSTLQVDELSARCIPVGEVLYTTNYSQREITVPGYPLQVEYQEGCRNAIQFCETKGFDLRELERMKIWVVCSSPSTFSVHCTGTVRISLQARYCTNYRTTIPREK